MLRLLNVETLSLEEIFDDTNTPPYAILSHRWGDHEVSFEQITKASAEDKKGFTKVQQTARLAKQAGLSYIWIDTCCIDKSSSSELQEAINSMFFWYRRSTVCFAYLCDINADACESDIFESVW
jgi:hypothetical protein